MLILLRFQRIFKSRGPLYENNLILEVIAETYINAVKNTIIQAGFNSVYCLQNIKSSLCINKVDEINKIYME